MKPFSAICIFFFLMMIAIPVNAAIINPPVQGESGWCKNDLTKWMCGKQGAQGAQGPEGQMNMTANMTAGPTGPQGPAGSPGAPGGDSGQIWYFNNTASDIAGYETLRNIPAIAPEIDEAVTINASHSPVLIDSYAMPQYQPNTSIIPAGLWESHNYIYMTPAVTGTVYENVSVFNRTNTGVETLLFSMTEQITSVTPTAYVIDYVQERNILIAPTDRLVVKIYGETSTVPDRTFHFVYQGATHTSHIHTPLNMPINSNSISHNLLLNLTIDSHPQYANLSGRVGGQTLNGGMNAGESLTLNASANGFGNIFFNIYGGNSGFGTSTTSHVIEARSTCATTNQPLFERYQPGLGTGTYTSLILASTYLNDMLSGFGTNLLFQIRDNANVYNSIAYIAAYKDGPDNSGTLTLATYSSGTPSQKLTILSNGNTTVGSILVNKSLFNVAGDMTISSLGAGTLNVDANGKLYTVSDEKTKTNITEYKPISALSKINGVKIYTYTWDEKSGLSTKEHNLGTISQQLKTVIPEAVYTKNDTKYEHVLVSKGKTEEENQYKDIEVDLGTTTDSVSDRAIISIQILAIQELSAKLDVQQATIDQQQKQIDELKARLDKAGIR